jgi:hypothetical protein
MIGWRLAPTRHQQKQRLILDDVETPVHHSAHQDGDREDLQVAQHLCGGGPARTNNTVS